MCSMPMDRRILASLGGHPLKRCDVRQPPASQATVLPAACIPSHGAASPGEGQATFQCREESLSRRGTECLFEVGQDVVNVLNANGQAYLGQPWWSPLKRCDVRLPPAPRALVLPAPAKGRQHFNAGKRA